MNYSETLRYYFFPYGMEKQTDGTWVLFNRRYKPVGFRTRDFVNYEDYPVEFRLAREDKRTLAKLSHTGKYDEERACVFFYDDGCIPTASAEAMDSYLEKMRVLMRLKIKAGEEPRLRD